MNTISSERVIIIISKKTELKLILDTVKKKHMYETYNLHVKFSFKKRTFPARRPPPHIQIVIFP